jgi:hypothetical protein
VLHSIRTFEVLLPLYFAFIPLLVSTPLVTAQTLVPGMHGMSIVPGVRFTWVIVSSDNEISINVRYNATDTTPPITIVATALTEGGQSTISGSQVLKAGWPSPNSIIVRLNGSSSLYDADLITVVASPYGNPPIVTEPPPAPIVNQPQASTETPNTQSGNGNNCDSSYPDFCIQPPPPTLNCSDIPQTGFTVLSPDRHDLDRDGNGIGCEE